MIACSREPVRTSSIFDRAGLDELPHARMVGERGAAVREELEVRAGASDILPQIVRDLVDAPPLALPVAA